MKTEAEIRDELHKCSEDRKKQGRNATLDINAPLALIQLATETRRDALRWVLEQ